MTILFHLFDKGVLRFSELERAIPSVSQKMLIQQLRALEGDGVVLRTVYPEVPPKVEYRLTDIGKELCPALDAILKWVESRGTSVSGSGVGVDDCCAMQVNGEFHAVPEPSTLGFRTS